MKKGIILFFLCVATNSFSQNELIISIEFPLKSGIACVDYDVFKVIDDTFYVMKRKLKLINLFSINDTILPESQFLYDTLKTYPISTAQKNEIIHLLSTTDSLGMFIASGCDCFNGWPRFFIYSSYNNKKMSGFITSCYREHIFNFIDLFNEIYPEGDVLMYNKQALIKIEEDCSQQPFRLQKAH